MTGRAAGNCAGYDVPGYAGFGRGLARRFGRGFGRGLGWRNRRWAGPDWDMAPAAPYTSREHENNWLKARAADLQAALAQINERLGNLDQE